MQAPARTQGLLKGAHNDKFWAHNDKFQAHDDMFRTTDLGVEGEEAVGQEDVVGNEGQGTEKHVCRQCLHRMEGGKGGCQQAQVACTVQHSCLVRTAAGSPAIHSTNIHCCSCGLEVNTMSKDLIHVLLLCLIFIFHRQHCRSQIIEDYPPPECFNMSKAAILLCAAAASIR